jgi:formylmethanofuran dehydrogenase subunit E-like metal-binding protein
VALRAASFITGPKPEMTQMSTTGVWEAHACPLHTSGYAIAHYVATERSELLKFTDLKSLWWVKKEYILCNFFSTKFLKGGI